MNIRHSILLFLFVNSMIFFQSDLARAQQVIDDETIVNNLRVLSDSLMKAHQMPALAIGIVRGDEVIMNEGFGFRDYENKLATNANTLFAIGSCTKAFTATSVAVLADKNLIDWNNPVKSYMPDFKLYDEFATKETTALDLLSHRSGLPRHDLIWYGAPTKRMELYDRLKYLEPTASFRTTFQYQNLMYMTAGILVEKITGVSWESFTKDHIIDPLEMSQSNFSVKDSKKLENIAYPYTVEGGKIKRIDFRNITEVGPAGSINSNINDMLKWVQFNLARGEWNNNQIISDEHFEILHNGHMIVNSSLGNRLQPEYGPFTYGGGWFVCEYSEHKIIWHGGGIDGFTAMVWLIPEKNIGMVVLSNVMSSLLPRVLVNYATDYFLGKTPKNWAEIAWPKNKENNESIEKVDETREKDTKPSQTLKDFAGFYFNPGYGKLEVKFVNGNLEIVYNSLNLVLNHYHFDVFDGISTENQNIRYKIQFYQNLDGSIKSMGIPLQSGLDPITFKKVDDN